MKSLKDCFRSNNTPNNESDEHFYLKQIAKILLKSKYNCKYIGSEVFLGKSIDKQHTNKYKNLPYNKKKIADAVGVEERKLKHMDHPGIIRNIEVKVSKSDFQSGYSVMGDYNYVMTPKGLLDIDDLPGPIGLIEVDFDELYIYYLNNKGIETKGINLTKYPRKMNDKKYIIGSHKDYVDWVIRRIAEKQTNNDVYKNNWINIDYS